MSTCPRFVSCRRLIYKALLFCGLLAACLSLTTPARAGSWSGPAYAFSGTDGNGKPWKWPVNSGTYNNPNSPGYSASGSASGTVTATFTWTPDPNNPSEPPTPLCVLEKGYANAGGGSSLGADDGLGDAATGGPTFPTSQGSHLTLAGTTSPVVLTHTLSDTCPNGIGEMTYQATGYPVTLGLGSTTPGSDGSANILIGQKCTGSLSGSGGTLSGWQWSVGGTTFQSWSGGTNASSYVDGPGLLNIATPSWCWNEKASTETVSCTATVTPPAGEGPPFTVTATKQVHVMEPQYTHNIKVGLSQVGFRGNSTGFWFFAGPPTDMSHPNGSDWYIQVTTPSLFGSAGAWDFVQVFTPGFWRTPDGGSEQASSINGQFGLDTSYPYAGDYADEQEHRSGDSPGTALEDAYQSYRVNNSFDTYVMYKPPGTNAQYVPLHKFSWSWSGSVTRPGTTWLNWPSGTNPGTLTSTNDQRVYTFPSWQKMNTAHW